MIRFGIYSNEKVSISGNNKRCMFRSGFEKDYDQLKWGLLDFIMEGKGLGIGGGGGYMNALLLLIYL